VRISFFSRIYIIIAIVTVLLYISIRISPEIHWIMAFLPLLIPFFIILNICFLIVFCLKRQVLFIVLSAIIVCLGYKFFSRTYQWRIQKKEAKEIKILNYNVRVFNSYRHFRDKKPSKLIEWVSRNEADIKCFQEFYNYPLIDSFNVIPKLKKRNEFYHFKPVSIQRNQYFGIAIFSKYPIVKKGEIDFMNATFNQAIFADIKIKEDTIRVYNVHLQSMSIDEKNLPLPESDNKIDQSKQLFLKIKKGAIFRSTQVKAIVHHMEKCPYKIILAGDLNDTPYSYTYEALSQRLKNAFESKGKGLGFTHNGKLFFLRIDNIFADPSIIVNSFKTRNDIQFTDHYPIEASFSLDKD
jgi:endonuclease/exonuclease/phosphatase family metal-dependent hydrolase